MPAEYPFKPPAFVMISDSGRFETGTKICLSISSYHPESWQPSWSVRSALIALIAFMQTPGNGAIGSIDMAPEVRKQIAKESRRKPPVHSSQDKQSIIDSLHQRLLAKEAESRASYELMTTNPVKSTEETPATKGIGAEETANDSKSANRQEKDINLSRTKDQNVQDSMICEPSEPGPSLREGEGQGTGHRPSHFDRSAHPMQVSLDNTQPSLLYNIISEDTLLSVVAMALLAIIGYMLLKKLSFISSHSSERDDMLSGTNLVQSIEL